MLLYYKNMIKKIFLFSFLVISFLFLLPKTYTWAAVCTPNAQRCDGLQKIQTCNSTGTSWTTVKEINCAQTGGATYYCMLTGGGSVPNYSCIDSCAHRGYSCVGSGQKCTGITQATTYYCPSNGTCCQPSNATPILTQAPTQHCTDTAGQFCGVACTENNSNGAGVGQCPQGSYCCKSPVAPAGGIPVDYVPNLPGPPCAPGALNSITCTMINSAIGNIPTDIGGFVRLFFNVILWIAGAIALILIIISGYRFMTSRGNPEAVQNAQDQLTAALIGLIFIILAFVILQTIGTDFLGVLK